MRLPEHVNDTLGRLRGLGYAAYVVGGCVRDTLLGREPADFDIATAATPERVIAAFARTIPTGLRYGTVTVVCDGGSIEVTTFRSDGKYTDGRRPSGVSFNAGIAHDLARRDFTVNAMAWSPDGLLDPHGGRADLEAKLIRCVGNPRLRFQEDALRILRAYRFASTLGFDIESDTREAMRECTSRLALISAERKTAELLGMLAGAQPDIALEAVGDGCFATEGLTPGCADKLRATGGLTALEGGLRLCGLAALIARACGMDAARSFITRGLRLPRRDAAHTLAVAHECLAPLPESRTDMKRRMAAAGVGAVRGALAVRRDALAEDVEHLCALLEDIVSLGECWDASGLALSGARLHELGLRGRAIGDAQRALVEHCIERPEDNVACRLEELARAKTPPRE